MTTLKPLESYHTQIREFFTTTATEKAKKSGFSQRKSMIGGSVFVMSLVMTVYRYGAITLDKIAGVGREIDPKCQVSEQGWGMRFGAGAVKLMKGMLVEALKITVPGGVKTVEVLKRFREVYLFDSSTVSFPKGMEKRYAGCGGSASKGAAKIFLVLGWLSGSYEQLQIEAGKKSDANMGKTMVEAGQPGALWIGDLGFFDIRFFQAVAKAGSWFLSRLKAGVKIRVTDEDQSWKPLELGKWLKVMDQNLFEVAVRIGINPWIECRMVAVRMPKAIADDRRRKAKAHARSKGYTLSTEILARIGWGLYVTNVPQAILPTSVISTVYQIRWQVELVFKLWKSQAGLDVFTAVKPDRVECEFYAKLIALVLFNRLLSALPEEALPHLSPPKAWNRLREQSQDWMRRLTTDQGLELLGTLINSISDRARVSKKRKKLSTLDLLNQVARDPVTCEIKNPLAYLNRSSESLAELPKAA
jgi:hypothetical protein